MFAAISKNARSFSTLAVAALMLAACSTANEGVSPNSRPADLLGAEWKIFEIGATPIVADSKPSILFADGRVTGNASCNRFTGGYETPKEKAKLKFDRIAMTMMACQPEGVMEQEGRLAKSLENVNDFTIIDGVLTLLADGQVVLKARR